MSDAPLRKYECVICGFIYDEAEGLPDDGFPPGTRWEDLPEEWAGKFDGELAKITGVADSVFCHNKRYVVVAETKESAIKLALMALNA